MKDGECHFLPMPIAHRIRYHSISDRSCAPISLDNNLENLVKIGPVDSETIWSKFEGDVKKREEIAQQYMQAKLNMPSSDGTDTWSVIVLRWILVKIEWWSSFERIGFVQVRAVVKRFLYATLRFIHRDIFKAVKVHIFMCDSTLAHAKSLNLHSQTRLIYYGPSKTHLVHALSLQITQDVPCVYLEESNYMQACLYPATLHNSHAGYVTSIPDVMSHVWHWCGFLRDVWFWLISRDYSHAVTSHQYHPWRIITQGRHVDNMLTATAIVSPYTHRPK